jgi:CRP/FNR family transcriptional regulator, cyclic AMP receptor protein
MLSPPRVRLLEADPDFGAFLTAEERAEARQLAVPVLNVGREEDGQLEALMQQGASGALVLEGMVLRQLRVGDQLGMTVLGPGDIIGSSSGPVSMLVGGASLRALPGTQLALLGREVVVAMHRWPSLVTALQARYVQQADRLATQMVVCQLPRVDQRLLALMWLLAESWGRVTPAGTTLPLRLTHDALGALVGARRPTVSLALRALTIVARSSARTSAGCCSRSPPRAHNHRRRSALQR